MTAHLIVPFSAIPACQCCNSSCSGEPCQCFGQCARHLPACYGISSTSERFLPTLQPEAGLSSPNCCQQSFLTSRPWVTLAQLLFFWLCLQCLLKASPVRFSRRMFHPFWTGCSKAEVEYLFLWFACFTLQVLWFWGLGIWEQCLDQYLPSVSGKSWHGRKLCLIFNSDLHSVFFGEPQSDCCFPTDAVFHFQAFLGECFGLRLLLWGTRRILSGALYPLALFLLSLSSQVTAVHASHFLSQYKILKFLWWPCAPASSC